MTKTDAEEYVRSCGELDGPDGDINLLGDLFAAIYGREIDNEEYDLGPQHIWSEICAGVSDEDAI